MGEPSSSPRNPPKSGGPQEGVLLEQKWNHMFQKLVEYKQKYGNCLVPNRWREGKTFLGAWVSTQRRQYKLLLSGGCESSTMTPERASRLEKIGFAWETNDPRHVPWEIRYQQLLEYKTKYGDCVVPIGYKKNVKLANWVSTQRQEYKLLIRGRTSRLSTERIAKLKAIGFVWEAQRGGPRRNIGLEDEDTTPNKSQIASKRGSEKTHDSSTKDGCVLDASQKNAKRPSVGLPPNASSIHPPQKKSKPANNGTEVIASKKTKEMNRASAQQDPFLSQSRQQSDGNTTSRTSAPSGGAEMYSRHSTPPFDASKEISAAEYSNSLLYNSFPSSNLLAPDKVQSLLGLNTMSLPGNSFGHALSLYPPNVPPFWPSFAAQDMGNAMRLAEMAHHAASGQGFSMRGNNFKDLEILKAHKELSGVLNHLAMNRRSHHDPQTLARQQPLFPPNNSGALVSSMGRGGVIANRVDTFDSAVTSATTKELQETLNNPANHAVTINVAGGVFDDAEEDDVDLTTAFRKS